MFATATSIPTGSRVTAVNGVCNLVLGGWFTAVLDGVTNAALSLSGEQPAQAFVLELIQPLSGGPFALPTFWSGITWLTADGAAPTLPPTAGAVLLLSFKCLGGAYYGSIEGAEASPLRTVNGRLTGTVTTTSATQGTNPLTGLSFPIGAGEQWTADFYLAVSGSTGGAIFQVTGPASPTDLRMMTIGNTTAVTAISVDTQTAFATGSAAWIVNATPFTGLVQIHLCVNNGSTAGTVALTFAAQTATQSNAVLQDSYLVARKIN
jgi:hypothetical protein